ncbi:MAG: carbohydrate binding domain-containing protein [Lentisphaeria bacterium]|nr:carbohydrate binding domain-containing protein [Lentisphaeria bacterium]
MAMTGSSRCAAATAETQGWFPFVMRGTDVAADSPVDVSFLNRGAADRRIAVRSGQFVTDDGRRVRFLGTNVTFSGAFPEKDQAPAIARRLAQLGFNVVRFHHMDARDIWLPGQKELDPQKLDRLDWFLAQLKQNGVYSNINLHVSRTYPGLAESGLPRTFRYGKILDIYYEPYILLQEQYARDLLDRVNPYTGLKLSQDPAIAFVELNNENTLLQLGPSQLAELTEPDIRNALRDAWRAWLRRRYANLEALEAAWNVGEHPLGDEMLRNRTFAGDLEEWTLEGAAPGVCAMARDGDGGVHIRVEQPGKVAWAYQLHQLDVPFEEGLTYTIRLRGRSDPPRAVSVSLRYAEAPWTVLSGSHSVALTPQWQEHVVVCRVAGLRQGVRLRFSLNLGDAVGEVWFAEPSLRPGRELFATAGVAGLDGMDLPAGGTPPKGWGDFRRCLVELEQAYVRRLTALLKDRLGVRALVVDTQASYGNLCGLQREASLCDYIDMHAYWQHPHFPNRPWDAADWTIGNTSMVADPRGGTLARLAAYRHAGMPFSVSEYNHPAPNDHAAELFPLLAAFAAYQDWDALYQFSYCNNDSAYGSARIGGYFELVHHAAQLVFAPLAALVFRQELLAPGAPATVLAVAPAAIDAHLDTGFPALERVAAADAVSPRSLLGRPFAVRLDPDAPAPAGGAPDGAETAAGLLIDAGGLRWETGEQARFTVTAPAVRMALGRIGGQQLTLGDVTLRLDLPEGVWACVALVAADSRPLDRSGRMLLAVVTRAENSGMTWDEQRRSVGRNWGGEPVLAEGIPFELRGPGPAPRAFALDAKGERDGALPVETDAAGWRLRVPEPVRTLWYALERP